MVRIPLEQLDAARRSNVHGQVDTGDRLCMIASCKVVRAFFYLDASERAVIVVRRSEEPARTPDTSFAFFDRQALP